MADRLHGCYEKAGQLGGVRGKVRLALLTGMSSTEAANTPDAPALLARFEQALAILKRELAPGSEAGGARGEVGQPAASETTVAELRRRNGLLVDLMAQRQLFFSDEGKALARATEVAAAALEVARVSIWRLERVGAVATIRCVDLFERNGGLHSAGAVLRADSFPRYFAALETERTIAAHDAHHDPRTAEFSEPYLTPLGINSMLDVPIWVGAKMVGVICHEQVGPGRVWTRDDEDFANIMSSFLAIAIERSDGWATALPPGAEP